MKTLSVLSLLFLVACGTNAPQPPVVCLYTCFAADGECFGYTTEQDPKDCGIVAYENIDKHAMLSNEDTETMKNYAGTLREYIMKQDKALARCRRRR